MNNEKYIQNESGVSLKGVVARDIPNRLLAAKATGGVAILLQVTILYSLLLPYQSMLPPPFWLANI